MFESRYPIATTPPETLVALKLLPRLRKTVTLLFRSSRQHSTYHWSLIRAQINHPSGGRQCCLEDGRRIARGRQFPLMLRSISTRFSIYAGAATEETSASLSFHLCRVWIKSR